MTSELESYYRQGELWDLSRYETSPEQRLRARVIASFIAPDTESVLDVGCGNGFVTRQLTAGRVLGLDPSPEALERFEGESVLGSAEALPFDDRSFEAVVCAEVLEHLPQDVFVKAARELDRVARRAIVVGVPYRQDLRTGMRRCADCGVRYHVELHQRSFSGPEAIARLLSGWRVQAVTLLGSQRRIRSEIFRALRYRVAPVVPAAGLGRCPECGSANAAGEGSGPFRRLFKALAWRMPKRTLAKWMIVLLVRAETHSEAAGDGGGGDG